MKIRFFYFYLIISALFLNSGLYSQIVFEPGYFITNSGEKVDCLIKDYAWKNNPEFVFYKKNENSKEKKLTIKDIREFSVNNKIKFKRFIVDIDKSSNDINNLDTDRNPHFVRDTLFLNVLIEGKASLYEYKKNILLRYFYNVDNKPVKQLIYKLYMYAYTGEDEKMGKNEFYKQQLLNDLKCPKITTGELERLRYKKSDLTNLFIKYNKCVDSDFVTYNIQQKKGKFNFYTDFSFDTSSLSIASPYESRNNELDQNSSLGYGAEVEYMLPFNKQKWGIFLKTKYNEYEAIHTSPLLEDSEANLITNVTYQSVELMLGERFYMYLFKNPNYRLFLHSALVIDNPINDSNIYFYRDDGFYLSDTYYEIQSKFNFMLGVGLSVNRFSLELNYFTSRNISNLYQMDSEFKKISLGFRFKLL